jgi:hypothetical protein
MTRRKQIEETLKAEGWREEKPGIWKHPKRDSQIEITDSVWNHTRPEISLPTGTQWIATGHTSEDLKAHLKVLNAKY